MSGEDGFIAPLAAGRLQEVAVRARRMRNTILFFM
jgi:hypothetical protein